VSRVDPSGWYAEATQRCRMDGGPGLHPSIRSKVTMILAPDGSLLYLNFNYIGYFESFTLFGDALINGQCPLGSWVTETTYEPSCDSSGLDRYGMDVMYFAEKSTSRWEITDVSKSAPMIIGDCIGGIIIIGGTALILYAAGPGTLTLIGKGINITLSAANKVVNATIGFLSSNATRIRNTTIGFLSTKSFKDGYNGVFGCDPPEWLQLGWALCLGLIK